MFNFFKRSKSQKSKQKQDRTQQSQQPDAVKSAALGACVPNSEETPHPSPPAMQLDQDTSTVSPTTASSSPSCSGNGGEGESVKNKQHSPPTAASILTSPNDIIRENGRSFGVEDDDGSVIEFADEGETDDDDNDEEAINECEDPRVSRRQRGEQSTSINQSANLLESTMAKGKNKRRYQGGKNVQQQQQQQQQHQGQKQSTKDNHLLELKQACNVTAEKINLEGDTKQPVTVVTTNVVTQSAENVVKVHESDDSKVNHGEHNSKPEEPKVKIVNQNTAAPCVLTAGDVNGKNAEDHEDKNSIVPRSETVNNKPSLAEDRETPGDAGVSENPTPSLQTVTSPIPLTQTDTTLDVVGGNELLNSSLVAEPCPTAELHSSTDTESHEIKDGPREPTASSETVTSKHVTSSNEEMGQQPSKPSEPLNNNCRRSITPNRQSPPTLVIQQPPQQQPHLTVPAKIEDAARDDISDDRDVFYEAKESLSPGTPAAATASLDQTEPLQTAIQATTKEASPLKAIIVSPNQSEPRASPKKRVVFSEQLILEGNPLQEFDLCNSSSASSSANSSTESLPNALNLEAPSYEEHLVQKNADRMQTESSPGSLVNNNNHKNSVNIVLSVCNDPPNAFNSDNSGISPSVPPPPAEIIATKPPNLIEFKYNSSDGSSATKLQNGHHKEAEKEESKRRSQSLPILGNEPTLIAEDTISLPDVVQPSNADKATKPFNTVDKLNSEMKELVNQESRYSAKLEDAEKRASEAETKVFELRRRLDEVERDASLKECNIERLKAELDAACRECEGIRGRLRTQDAEIDSLRLKSSNQEDELNLKYQNLEVEMLELTEKLKDTRQMANELNVQLVEAKAEAETLRLEKEKLQEERAEEQKIIKEALELALKERSQVEAKWKCDFEQLRTHHSDREEHLMEDCEWKLRSMQKNCKEKLEAVERERKAAIDKATRLEQENRNNMAEAIRLRSFEGEATKLRGLTNDQKETLTVMTRQIDRLRNELEDASNKLEAEIVKAQQLKTRCEYQICEKEREALNRIEIARGEIAMQWEDRLLHEMNRLRVEMEQTNLEDRLSAINRFKREALQETEELTQKFNMREKQLKEEIESLKKTIERQKQAMEDAQSEADTKLMQSRMFVDRRERELEEVLVRETTQRDQVIAELKEQHEKEKRDMEQHFSLRIQQVQEEFERELSDATEMLKVSHKKELEKQWKQLVSEKEEALQLMESRQRTRLEEAENKISIQNDESGSSPSTTKSRTLHDTNNNIITKLDDSESGPVSNVLHLVVDFVKGSYPLFPALVAHFQFESWAFSLLTLVATLALVVYLQLRLINRD
ncbi:apical junction molecule isoform X3 [Culex quinquefasciatus]|uniref:apical junction molecule isoform X3 n=1 Tax=Culex quinquefasciatus TaxID=7176 RepID=UPI0018E3E1D4|nr:apical junction molecule isoform X3 [Culex quinquefasciatus]